MKEKQTDGKQDQVKYHNFQVYNNTINLILRIHTYLYTYVI